MSNLKVSKDAIYATGGRKESTSRVYMQKGKGNVIVNGKTAQDYFGEQTLWFDAVMDPLKLLEQTENFDCICYVKGGGVTGQADSIRLGISKCLDIYEKTVLNRAAVSQADTDSEDEEGVEPTLTWRQKLRKKGYLTRDPRAVLRKRVGYVKARKKPQYSKR
jgi:small subunit ribosomal protein S9|tara:strand:- start:221 stop:706 length:486 start_codon:yes stop_codon:yes gene_type:complete